MKTKNVDHDLLPARHSTSPGCETPSSAFWAKTRHHGLGPVETTLNRGRHRPHRPQQPRSASAPCELQRATCATNSNTAARLLRIPLGSQGYKRQNESGMHAPVRHRITSSAHKKHNARTRARVHTYIHTNPNGQPMSVRNRGGPSYPKSLSAVARRSNWPFIAERITGNMPWVAFEPCCPSRYIQKTTAIAASRRKHQKTATMMLTTPS